MRDWNRMAWTSGAVAGLIFALASIFVPEELLVRFKSLTGPIEERLPIMRGFGFSVLAVVVALWFEKAAERAPLLRLTVVVSAVAAFFVFASQLSEWWIDDAGITFAYSRSVAEGVGCTFRPGEPATEGYSSSLWMLLLASLGAVGVDIPTAAKALGVTFGAVMIALTAEWLWRETKSLPAVALACVALGNAPFVVWCASGQEHAMQALLLQLAVMSVWCRAAGGWQWGVGLVFSALVLVRPEAPVIVAFAFFAVLLHSKRNSGAWQLKANLPFALMPFCVFVGLMVWRISYFGDSMPNPYYAKAGAGSLSGLVMPFGGGWSYVLDGLRDSGLVALLPLWLIFPTLQRRGVWVAVLAAVIAGHGFFVIWAKGDWMGQYRFLMPIVALLVVPAGLAAASLKVARAVCVVLSVYCATVTVVQLDRFSGNPTTPLSVVSDVGAQFRELADRLGLDEALLAHHDAGAISYERSLRLLDLGGLVDRQIAKHLRDRDFLVDYVLVEKRPDFIFGARNFAAASGFVDDPLFERDYVPLRFPDAPFMESEFSHIRRTSVRAARGVEVRRGAGGALVEVVCRDL